MEKKLYEELVLEVINFSDEDVLGVSGYLGESDDLADIIPDPLGSLKL
jgi:hypothetical protein